MAHQTSRGGRGLKWVVPRHVPWPALLTHGSWSADRAGQWVAVDWYLLGRGPLTPVDVPWSWLSAPLAARTDPPINQAAVTRLDAGTAYAADQDSIDTYGYWAHEAELDTDSPADPRNLAAHLVASYPDPRVRLTLTIPLRPRTDSQCRLLLAREVGDRVQLTDTPAGWPAGGTQLVIEGIRHESTTERRVVTWMTSPLVGSSADVAGPWFRLGVSTLDGDDTVPF